MGTEEAAQVISTALKDRRNGSLMRHELAYILGQMQIHSISNTLISLLSDETEDVLVRHESGEALGALGSLDYLPILQQFVNHERPEIAETCQIAVDLIQYRHNNNSTNSAGLYLSVDPAPPMNDDTNNKSISDYKEILLNPSLSLFDRYRAMFTLRDMNSDESALALVEGFNDSSALFRHEIAYVLGQMQRPVTVPGLSIVLNNLNEHEMVRHEAAESLGSIGTLECEEILNLYRDDNKQVVKESCLV
eukprot:CAMPEP_0174822442 /NCGR_PEP_ID=MMETSP1107-20130205/15768_1 /TAXON_ID=36770 /ORGANISM="Paraphysomonas vestita, Strain GFlagA" /LENGTH=248 /DNA_ID=CAMNT_0016041315 /DNA_START=39 /DNA_END=781 /DNA_ORIENTATION=+